LTTQIELSSPTTISALREWRAAVGEEHVTVDESTLSAAEKGTFATSFRISAIVRPGSREEVQECMRIANRWRTPVYPISSGRNWGYGSRTPCADGCVLLDLGRMDRIVDFSEELAYVTVEPGVTQAQLFAYLKERGSRLWMDATGSSPHCSLIGNTMERGFGHTPYGDHFGNACGLEVVLPSGETLGTGLTRFPSASAGPLYKWGVGPSIDGLFSQSNLGIVTRMTIWLMPEPEYFQAYYFKCESAEALGQSIEALRPLRLNGTIRSSSHIANDYKLISGLRQYPWEETGGETPLRGEPLEKLRRELKIGAWSGSGALYGTKVQVEEAGRLLRIALEGKASQLQFLDDDMLAMAANSADADEKASGWNMKRMLAVLKPVYGLMKGIPTDQPLASTYWRKRMQPPADMNPDRDGCGLIWCSPIAPNEGAHAVRLTGLASELMLRHGFEPIISLTVLTDRTLSCIINVAYDRATPGEDDRAMACYRELLACMAENGYHSYRLTTAGMSATCDDGPYSATLRAIKDLLDPNGILAPGRYIAARTAGN
jgi:4-cresol dehydrogenase (hydroxylating)